MECTLHPLQEITIDSELSVFCLLTCGKITVQRRVKLTGTPGIAEEDESPHHASLPLALHGDVKLEPVASHRG